MGHGSGGGRRGTGLLTACPHVVLHNGAGAAAGFHPLDAKILQGIAQVDATDSLEYGELAPQSNPGPGVRSEGA